MASSINASTDSPIRMVRNFTVLSDFFLSLVILTIPAARLSTMRNSISKMSALYNVIKVCSRDQDPWSLKEPSDAAKY